VSDDPTTPKYNAMMDRIAARLPDRVRAIDLADEVCPDGACPPFLNGMLVRVDGLHFSAPFADALAPHLERKLDQVGVRLG
jgi:hypothetical protein